MSSNTPYQKSLFSINLKSSVIAKSWCKMRLGLLVLIFLGFGDNLSAQLEDNVQHERSIQMDQQRISQSDETSDEPRIIEHTFYIFDYDNQESKQSLELLFLDKLGIISVTSDLEAQTLTVSADSRISSEHIASIIVASGLKKSKNREEHLTYKRRTR